MWAVLGFVDADGAHQRSIVVSTVGENEPSEKRSTAAPSGVSAD
jgi:hypothetical protein